MGFWIICINEGGEIYFGFEYIIISFIYLKIIMIVIINRIGNLLVIKDNEELFLFLIEILVLRV